MKRKIPRIALISLSAALVCAVVYALCLRMTSAADFINSTISSYLRVILAALTYPIPFSVFELLIIISPVILFITLFLLFRKGADSASRVRVLLSVASVVSLIFSSYLLTLGVGYHTTELADKMSLEENSDIGKDELYETTLTVIDEMNSLVSLACFDGSETYIPYSYTEMSGKLVSAYDALGDRFSIVNNFHSRIKPVRFSTVMSDLGITGIYSFFTGEANVNVEYPDYQIVFTSAHELAHQRGICRENEANFVAFLVCTSSDDPYIRYCGYLSLYEYLASALYRIDEELYYDALSRLSPVALSDLRAARRVYNEHKDSLLGEINDRINDAYLKANGTEGVVTYGYVVRLAVAYYQSEYVK